jgi:hypothetical protein
MRRHALEDVESILQSKSKRKCKSALLLWLTNDPYLNSKMSPQRPHFEDFNFKVHVHFTANLLERKMPMTWLYHHRDSSK